VIEALGIACSDAWWRATCWRPGGEEIAVPSGTMLDESWIEGSRSSASTSSRYAPDHLRDRLRHLQHVLRPHLAPDTAPHRDAIGVVAAQSIGEPARNSRCGPSTSRCGVAFDRADNIQVKNDVPCACTTCARSSRKKGKLSRCRFRQLSVLDANGREKERYHAALRRGADRVPTAMR